MIDIVIGVLIVIVGFIGVGFLYGLMARVTGWDPVNATEEVGIDE